MALPTYTETPHIKTDPFADLERWVFAEMVKAQHGTTLEDAGRVSAYSRVLVRLRERR